MYSGSFRSPPGLEEVEDEEDREEVEDDNGLVEPEGGFGAFLLLLGGDPDLGDGVCVAEEDLLPGLPLLCIGLIDTCLSPSERLLEPFSCGGSMSICWLFRLLDLEGLAGSWGTWFPSGGILLLSCCNSAPVGGAFLLFTRVISMCVMGIGSLNLSPENILFRSGSCVGEILVGVPSSLFWSSFLSGFLTGDAVELLRGEVSLGSGVDEEE